jgi:hypothetical protein
MRYIGLEDLRAKWGKHLFEGKNPEEVQAEEDALWQELDEKYPASDEIIVLGLR